MPRISGKIPRITIRGETGLCVTEEDWRKIEESYGHQIPDEARSAVNAVTNKFLQLASAEDNAPSKAEALERLEKLKDRTDSLLEAINELPVGNPIRQYVDEEIAFAYSDRSGDASARFEAAEAIFKSRQANALPAIEAALAKEQDGCVKRALTDARAAIQKQRRRQARRHRRDTPTR
jgi:hypothetical protein